MSKRQERREGCLGTSFFKRLQVAFYSLRSVIVRVPLGLSLSDVLADFLGRLDVDLTSCPLIVVHRRELARKVERPGFPVVLAVKIRKECMSGRYSGWARTGTRRASFPRLSFFMGCIMQWQGPAAFCLTSGWGSFPWPFGHALPP